MFDIVEALKVQQRGNFYGAENLQGRPVRVLEPLRNVFGETVIASIVGHTGLANSNVYSLNEYYPTELLNISKPITPRRGELWEKGGTKWFFFRTTEGLLDGIDMYAFRSHSNLKEGSIEHGKNGWVRLYPSVEE